ncbi:Hachiman antiphage defense system protein HamA [Achromobacter xylosoxidans]|uniref:Hachiman antiphage defense system protein HamA n=1 Tax=Alcaligenes xylosoxydans xylosoxydans TaxID=85698 RepID=UPI0014036F29|nr:Hachiman antiphage defense system protein HamA [Achromobacter xylosoxidans]MBC9907576.1 DUF1837 domain-containing protein [Achromobacter xylosoxidans]MBD0871354.1 DUF1837 domain-containing protein [Achromobacter xylosoxidans]QNP86009.1 DUF1837 domain-containing protein [Achromobacter xylosoxidans]
MSSSTSLPHSTWFKEIGRITTSEGRPIALYRFDYNPTDAETMSAWARHFREHYCLDSQIDRLRRGTPYSRSDYLNELKFPDQHIRPGPSVRSGDFSEILIVDLLETIYQYFIPRTRYGDKKSRNESAKGSDIIGLKILSQAPSYSAPDDVLVAVETKAQLTGKTHINRLQDAVNDSWKDSIRIATSLNSMKQRLLDLNLDDDSDYVERFQDPMGKPYIQKYGAVAVFSTPVFDADSIAETICLNHPGNATLALLCVYGEDLMNLAHALYKRAADEA